VSDDLDRWFHDIFDDSFQRSPGSRAGSAAVAGLGPGPDTYVARRDQELRKTIAEVEAKAERQRKRDRPIRIRRFEC
jgi:hypothetical protein